MVGIEPYVDIIATMALLNSKKAKKIDCLEKDQGRSKLSILHKLDLDERRRLQMIMAGSVRAPHRLKHTGKMQSDKYDHPHCAGTRCDTEHIFWKCGKYSDVRAPSIEEIESKLQWLKKVAWTITRNVKK